MLIGGFQVPEVTEVENLTAEGVWIFFAMKARLIFLSVMNGDGLSKDPSCFPTQLPSLQGEA